MKEETEKKLEKITLEILGITGIFGWFVVIWFPSIQLALTCLFSLILAVMIFNGMEERKREEKRKLLHKSKKNKESAKKRK